MSRPSNRPARRRAPRAARWIAAALLAWPFPVPAADPPPALDLASALAAARRTSPELALRRAEVEERRAALTTARTYPFNPELAIEAAHRAEPSRSFADRAVEIEQEVEIAGQRGERRRAAEAALAGARRRLERAERAVDAAVETAFAEAVGTRERLRVARADAELTRHLLTIEERRLEAGAGTEIELNVARAAAGRAARGVELSRSADLAARSLLAERTALPAGEPPRPAGGLAQGTDRLPATPELAELLAAAHQTRADLAALGRDLEAARVRVSLERSRVVPNLHAGLFVGREEGTSRLTGVRLGWTLPLFDRNRGAIKAARAAAARTAAEGDRARLEVDREVASARARYRAATASVAALRELVLGHLEENLDLLERALEAGKVSTVQVLVVRRELVDGERELIDALTEAWTSRVELELAAGRPLSSFSPHGARP